MKDKLIKNGHKAGYYRFRKFSLGLVVSLSAFFIILVPTYISINYQNEQGQAEQYSSSENTDEEKNSEQVKTYQQD